MKVCEKVQRKGTTSYNEVADELVAEFSAADNHILPNESVSLCGVGTGRPGVTGTPALHSPLCYYLRHLQVYREVREQYKGIFSDPFANMMLHDP